MSVIEEARRLRALIKKTASETEDKTLAIAASSYFAPWAPGAYAAGDVRTDPENGYPYECILAHDSTVNTDWTIKTRTLWKPYHSRKKEYALPWEAPTGAHDRYKAGEFMVWTDCGTYRCLTDTTYSPEDNPAAWERQG